MLDIDHNKTVTKEKWKCESLKVNPVKFYKFVVGYSPSLKMSLLLVSILPFELNGWFKATNCIENPNTNMANTAKNLARSFIKLPASNN